MTDHTEKTIYLVLKYFKHHYILPDNVSVYLDVTTLNKLNLELSETIACHKNNYYYVSALKKYINFYTHDELVYGLIGTFSHSTFWEQWLVIIFETVYNVNFCNIDLSDGVPSDELQKILHLCCSTYKEWIHNTLKNTKTFLAPKSRFIPLVFSWTTNCEKFPREKLVNKSWPPYIIPMDGSQSTYIPTPLPNLNLRLPYEYVSHVKDVCTINIYP